VVTGGSSGIRLATGQRFVQNGAYVFIVGRSKSDKVVKDINKIVTVTELQSNLSQNSREIVGENLVEAGLRPSLIAKSVSVSTSATYLIW
jgi:NAD(P)-dependent dehydrogenase (short-subunit alcohol dehydrogenase family)